MEKFFYVVTIKNPFAWLIANGYQLIDNRDEIFPSNLINKFIGLHTAKQQYSLKQRHELYSHPLIKHCLSNHNNTKHLKTFGMFFINFNLNTFIILIVLVYLFIYFIIIIIINNKNNI